MNWTPEQTKVLQTYGSNTLVSASAGSGKTAVMVEWILRNVVGENDSHTRIPLRNMMIVTFSVAIADELKLKLAKELRKCIRAGRADADYLRDQLEDLPLCTISTLHAMCANLVRTHFDRAGVDPSFGILEEETKAILLNRSIDEVIAVYEEQRSQPQELLSKLFGGRARLTDELKRLYEFVVAQPDREDFLQRKLFACCASLDEKPLVTWYLGQLRMHAQAHVERLQELQSQFTRLGMDDLAVHAADVLRRMQAMAQVQTYAASYDVYTQAGAFLRKPSLKKPHKGDPVCEEYDKAYKSCYDDVKDEWENWSKVLTCPPEQAQEYALAQQPLLACMADMIADVIERYSAYKREINRLDFNDLEWYAIRLLSDEAFAATVRARYDCICVDEYQDINAVQEAILLAVSRGDNMFMVGDSKQSIYQFRLTDPRIFMAKFDAFSAPDTDGQARVLNHNFRSCEPVLRFVNRIFDRVMTQSFGGVDYRNDARLVYGNTRIQPWTDRPVRVALFPRANKEVQFAMPEDGIYSVREHRATLTCSVDYEGLWIARQIADLVGTTVTDAEGNPHKITYSDMTLLCEVRSPRVQNIVRTLRACRIPVDATNISASQTNESVSVLINLLQAVDNPKQDYVLIGAMTSVFGGFSLQELAAIRGASMQCEYFYQAAEGYPHSDALGDKIQRFYAMLTRLRTRAAACGVSDLMRDILLESDYDMYLRARPEAENERAQLHAFIQSLQDKTYNASIPAFLDFVRDYPDVCRVQDVAAGSGNFVQTATIHQSKGLEYPIVFLIDAGRLNRPTETTAYWLMDKDFGGVVSHIDPLAMVYEKHPVMYMMAQYKANEILESKLRLFYVALTRAKHMLFVSGVGTADTKVKSPDRASKFLDWVFTACASDPAMVDDYFCDAQIDDADREIELPHVTFRTPDANAVRDLQSRLDLEYPHIAATQLRIKHSVTEINHMSVPERPAAVRSKKDGATVAQGIAYHRVLEGIEYTARSPIEVQREIDRMVVEEWMTPEQAQCVDPAVIASCLCLPVMEYARNHPHMREKEFMLYLPANRILPDCKLTEKVLLQGTVDLVVFGEQTVLVDFKYSARGADALRDAYATQLRLYALAIRECTGKQVDRCVLVSVADAEEIEVAIDD